jgi:serine protease Do
MGAGFSIDKEGRILTANHVVKNVTEVVVNYINQDTGEKKVFPVSRWRGSEDLDVAILYTNTQIPSVTVQGGGINNLNNYALTTVAYLGFPLQSSVNGNPLPVLTAFRGSVSSIIPFQYQGVQLPVYVLGASANKGNSGGPVISLKTGEVIGIVNAGFTDTQGITISTPINQNLINSMTDSNATNLHY